MVRKYLDSCLHDARTQSYKVYFAAINDVISTTSDFSHKLADVIVHGLATSHSTTNLDEAEGESKIK